MEKRWDFRDHGTRKLGVSHKCFDEFSRLIEWYLYTESDGYHWSYQNFLFWACIVWHRLWTNQIVRCFKLKKLENYMRYQVDFLLPLKLKKISYYFGLCQKILLANQFAGFFTFDLFDLLILILGVHCYIVLVFLWCKQLNKNLKFWWGTKNISKRKTISTVYNN